MSEVSEDANEENIKDKYIDTVSRFLLNREIRDVCTLNEMRSHFPSKYRSDVVCQSEFSIFCEILNTLINLENTSSDESNTLIC